MKATFPNELIVENLIESILLLENKSEAKKFLRDLLTEGEIIEFAKRWEAAKMLSMGSVYTDIEERTGLSSTTIARISKWLTKGAGGYTMMLQKINKKS